MKKIIIILAVIAVMFLFWILRSPEEASGLTGFAQCLASKNITMYGADWCPHCQNEKKAFGSSFEYVPYVECPDNPKQCLDAGIKGYPTWIFPDGRKLEGEQGIKTLSQESGCALPENK